jgi:hypothetical protein
MIITETSGSQRLRMSERTISLIIDKCYIMAIGTSCCAACKEKIMKNDLACLFRKLPLEQLDVTY